LLPVTVAGSLCLMLVLAPAAAATTPHGGRSVALGFLGLPSLHSIIEAIAKGFFSALAGALVPGFLKHGTVATIQHLVALPDPTAWGHVGELEGDMTFLGMSLMPVTLAVCTLRYWMMGLSGAAHPVTALSRCVWATGALVAYRWLVEETVAATNTLTHAILGFPVVANGLASIITVLFGGALLLGAGGVFGAFLVIVGVVFAAGLFASAEALTVLLALVFCVGPLFIALAPIPELSHLARVWGHALMAIVLVPVGWTMLFATAGALTLDATSFTGGAAGLPGHIAAAFAGLITFVLAVKLPLMLFGELRNILGGALHTGGSAASGAQGRSVVAGGERVRAAHARLRSVATDGLPSLGRSAGRAAGAMGAPDGGPVGAARRGLAGAAQRTGGIPATPAAGAIGGMPAGRAAGAAVSAAGGRSGVRGRLAHARTILASAPREARAAMAGRPSRAARQSARSGARAGGARASAATTTGKAPARVATRKPPGGTGGSAVKGLSPVARTTGGPAGATGGAQSATHPGRRVTRDAQRNTGAPVPPAARPPKPSASAPKGQRARVKRRRRGWRAR
jgi:hypothetical protein